MNEQCSELIIAESPNGAACCSGNSCGIFAATASVSVLVRLAHTGGASFVLFHVHRHLTCSCHHLLSLALALQAESQPPMA